MSVTDAGDDRFAIHLPGADGARALDQDAEWCEIETQEGTRRVRFHDYATIYSIPGLYERLFYDELECDSPRVVSELLVDVVATRDADIEALRVLDLGAGNGMMGEELADRGVSSIVGVDILEEAAAASARDRPGVYEDYVVTDLTQPSPTAHESLEAAGFNCLTSVAALGFGDIPPAAFAQAYDYVEPGGLIAFTIKERFVRAADSESGFGRLMRELEERNSLETLAEKRYQHRLSTAGESLHYLAYVAEKADDAPALELVPPEMAGP